MAGDEPRRARFNALLGRYLARAGFHEQAETTIKDGLLRASDDLVEQVPGFFPHHYLAAAWFDWSSFNYERARQSLAEARRFGELYENPWALREADDLASRLSAS